MLVLSRKKGESIIIDDDIAIVVVEILKDRVRLGVEAPSKVPVHRKEVYDAIMRGDLRGSGEGAEPNKPKEYASSRHYSPWVSCPNLDFFDSKLKGYNF